MNGPIECCLEIGPLIKLQIWRIRYNTFKNAVEFKVVQLSVPKLRKTSYNMCRTLQF